MRGLVIPTMIDVCRQSPDQPAALAFGNLGLSPDEEYDLLRQCRGAEIYTGVSPWPGRRLETGNGKTTATQ